MPLTRPSAAQINTVITTISDPITVLNKGSTAANIDVGFIINRNGGALANTAIFWNESANTFATAFTTASGADDANISISAYANLKVSTLTATFVNTTGNVSVGGNIAISGALYASGSLGSSGYTLQSTGSGIQWAAPSAGASLTSGTSNVAIVSSGGNIVSAIAGFKSLELGVAGLTVANNVIINANVTATFVNTTGNIMSGGNITAPYYFGNGSQLSGVITSVTKIINGTSDVTAYSGGNVAVSVGGTANTVVFTSSNIHITGSIIPTANVIYDLGSNSNRFRSAYFAGSTIYIGDSSISESTIASLNALISSFPSGDYGDISTSSTDAFGVVNVASFDCGAAGTTTTTDLGVLT